MASKHKATFVLALLAGWFCVCSFIELTHERARRWQQAKVKRMVGTSLFMASVRQKLETEPTILVKDSAGRWRFQAAKKKRSPGFLVPLDEDDAGVLVSSEKAVECSSEEWKTLTKDNAGRFRFLRVTSSANSVEPRASMSRLEKQRKQAFEISSWRHDEERVERDRKELKLLMLKTGLPEKEIDRIIAGAR
eukprot:CAMPEP_0197672714 /NCGR_PEP_ID=MMETSP1338-20131121/79505_1 /TAXON_ID=43686 ORGANISM="Pelagodinium beii, Strain RCC1491" /NCGR_SAMPLE_ID=MMETSP1338 /ASSEMBLY_ACC=CAM_ASM_000754 /LENGTH=191 /DNA_ID=CAMNT_0043252853 /DNA_START=28 /DNA_END=603 /DNA_ORIENTATION=-